MSSLSLTVSYSAIICDISLTESLSDQLDSFPEQFYLSEWDVSSDVDHSIKQLNYLIGLPQDCTVTRIELESALFYIRKSEKYKSVTLHGQKGPDGEWHLSFVVKGHWTLNRISVEGIWFGKDNFKQMYGLEPGGVFNFEKHEQALEHIKRTLIQDGYLEARVESCIEEEASTKTVNVTLSVYKGKRFTISGVSVLGQKGATHEQQQLLKHLLTSVSKHLVRSSCKQKYIDEQVDTIKNYLYHYGYPYAHVHESKLKNLENNSATVTFDVEWGAHLLSTVEGNKYFSDKQLKEHMMRGADSLWSISAPVCIRELKELYISKGFIEVAVECKQTEYEWRFIIDEGPRYNLDTVEFFGQDHFATGRLQKHFYQAVRRSYDDELVQRGVDAMIEDYLENGFWDVNVVEKAFDEKTEEHGNLHIRINEGDRRYLASINIPGYEDLLCKGPFVRLGQLELPVPFKMSYLREQRDWLLKHFKQKGFQSIHLKPELKEIDNGLSLTWIVQINGPQATFGKTIIKGSPDVNVDHIYRELCYDCGALKDKKQLERTFVRLKNLNIYETVSVYPLADMDPCGNQPIAIKVVTDDPFEMRTRIGFQQVSKNLIFREKATYKVGGSFIYKNVTGNVDQLRLDADFTRFYRILDVSYSLPWTFGVPVKTVVKGYCNKFDQPVYIGSKRTLYRARHNGGLIGGQYKQSSFNAALNIGGETTKIDHVSEKLARAIDFKPALVDKWVPYVSVEPNIFIESLNDKLYPRQGFMTLFSCKWMMPLAYKAEYFSKVLIEQALFFPISRVVFALRVRAGHIFTKNFSEIIPPERFYLGGPNSIRCYLPDLAPPVGRITTEKGDVCCFPQGGSSMVNMNFELRIPLLNSMTAVVFNDLGILTKPVNENEDSMSYEVCCPYPDAPEEYIWHQRLLGAVGLGVNYNTPIGPLRFDIGWNINRQRTDDSLYAWYLTLGHSF